MDKAPLQSKKFVAFLISEILWKVTLVIALLVGLNEGMIEPMLGGIILAATIVAGFLEATYIGGQAALDKYVTVAQIITSSGRDADMKGLSIKTRRHNDQNYSNSSSDGDHSSTSDGGDV